jgi:hypothetical protein
MTAHTRCVCYIDRILNNSIVWNCYVVRQLKDPILSIFHSPGQDLVSSLFTRARLRISGLSFRINNENTYTV